MLVLVTAQLRINKFKKSIQIQVFAFILELLILIFHVSMQLALMLHLSYDYIVVHYTTSEKRGGTPLDQPNPTESNLYLAVSAGVFEKELY